MTEPSDIKEIPESSTDDEVDNEDYFDEEDEFDEDDEASLKADAKKSKLDFDKHYVKALQKSKEAEPHKTIRQYQWMALGKVAIKEGTKSLNIFNLLKYLTEVGFSMAIFSSVIELIFGS